MATRPDGLAIKGAEDLARRVFRLINREQGAGARLALDETLRASGIKSDAVKGYTHYGAGHLEVAAAIAEGTSDAGVTIRMAAELFQLKFQP